MLIVISSHRSRAKCLCEYSRELLLCFRDMHSVLPCCCVLLLSVGPLLLNHRCITDSLPVRRSNGHWKILRPPSAIKLCWSLIGRSWTSRLFWKARLGLGTWRPCPWRPRERDVPQSCNIPCGVSLIQCIMTIEQILCHDHGLLRPSFARAVPQLLFQRHKRFHSDRSCRRTVLDNCYLAQVSPNSRRSSQNSSCPAYTSFPPLGTWWSLLRE
jgi:hypothetical protein